MLTDKWMRGQRAAGSAGGVSRWVVAVLAALGLWWNVTGCALAYDLSRAYASTADEVERGFVVGSAALWSPEVGNWRYYHQLSLDLGAEFGFRFASIQSAHNLYFVAGFNFSPQELAPDAVRADAHRTTNVMLGYGGVRYMTGFLCFGEGLGCPFAELRLGLVFETNDGKSGHDGPSGALTVVPGLGYRFSFGRAFQIGARFDFSYTEEGAVRDLGWLSMAGFAGVGW